MKNLLPFEGVSRNVLIRKEAVSNPDFGCKPEDRTTETLLNFGVVNIDKPAGPTSHQVSAFVKQILNNDKCGHSGTLDPNVTGCLPVVIGDATRIVQVLLPSGKEYVCVMHIHKKLPDEQVINGINEFIGKINQLPPVKSAVKRQERERKIYYIDIMEIKDQEVLFRVGCQAGTYIRKLCHDIGVKLGVGAHMNELRRTKAGPFNESTLFTLQDLLDALYYYKEEGDDTYIRKVIQPVEKAVELLPKVWIFDNTIDSLTHGVNLKVPGISKVNEGIQKGDMVAIMSLKEELVGIGVADMTSEDMVKDKGIAVKIDKVFMKVGVYPKKENNPKKS